MKVRRCLDKRATVEPEQESLEVRQEGQPRDCLAFIQVALHTQAEKGSMKKKTITHKLTVCL